MRSRTQDSSDFGAFRLLQLAGPKSAPSNDRIASVIGARTPAAGAAALKRLEAAGQIRVERPVPGWRVITVFTADGPKQTEGEDV